MRDTDRLRQKLLLLAGVFGSPALLLGCDSLGRSETEKNPVATASAAQQFHGASGKWCAPPTLARVFVITGSPYVGACAKFLDGSKADRAVLDAEAVEGLDSESFAFYDSVGTEQERAATRNASLCCYNWRERENAGRPLTLGGSTVTAMPRRARAAGRIRTDLLMPRSSRVRAALAGEWLADALSEHASVASFARAARELSSFGAPSELILAHHAAGRDEIDHARACFSIASAYAGHRLAAGPLPDFAPRSLELAELASATFEEAALGETVAALSASRAASECKDPAVRAVLERIARDETRHAALAWRTLKWAVALGGTRVARIVFERAAAQRAMLGKQRAARRAGDGFGRLDATGLAAARQDAWSEVTEPILSSLVS